MSTRAIFRSTIGLLLLIGSLRPCGAVAQSAYRISIDYIDNQRFPVVDAYISVSDSQGFLAQNLLGADFAVAEDGKPITGFKVTPVQNTKQPLAIVLVIDASRGMNTLPLPTPLQTSVSAAKGFIDSLQPQDRVAAIAYSDSPAVISDFSQDRSALEKSLDDLQAGNKASMYDAISNAVDLLKGHTERRLILLITDGRDTRSHTTIDEAISKANGAGVQIYPIGFGAVNNTQLYKLANGTGGSASIQPGASALQAAFERILQVLREQYLIEYVSTLPADSQKHSLQVQVTVQGSPATTSTDFVAQPAEVVVNLPYKDGDTVGGNVILEPAVLAAAPTARLEFVLDGASIYSASEAPFKYLWNSTTVTPGSHEITLKITDQAGNSGMATVHLNVQPPISVKITAPAADATLKGLTKITVQANTLPGHKVASVQIAVDERSPTTLAAPPYEISWDAALNPAGKHAIRVTAFDIDGFSAHDDIAVYVQPNDIAPWIVAAALVVLVGVTIPLALRSRKRKVGTRAAPSGLPRGIAGFAQLHELEGHSPDKVWSLGATEVRLGRKREENDIPLKGLKASRKHAVIRFERGQYVIEGLSPDNPVVVNDQAISQPRILQGGDVIKLGDTTLRFEQS